MSKPEIVPFADECGNIGFRFSQDAVVYTADEQQLIIDEFERIVTESANLRELVHILAYCMSEDRDCDKCVLNGADMPMPHISACDSLPDRMRELGIEVG